MSSIRLPLVYSLIDGLSFASLSLPPEGNLVVVDRHDTPLAYDSSASIVSWSIEIECHTSRLSAGVALIFSIDLHHDTDDARGQKAITG